MKLPDKWPKVRLAVLIELLGFCLTTGHHLCRHFPGSLSRLLINWKEEREREGEVREEVEGDTTSQGKKQKNVPSLTVPRQCLLVLLVEVCLKGGGKYVYLGSEKCKGLGKVVPVPN
jgi:hypothetical protein